MEEETPEKIAYSGILTMVTILLIVIVALGAVNLIVLSEVQEKANRIDDLETDITRLSNNMRANNELLAEFLAYLNWKDNEGISEPSRKDQLDPEIIGTNISFTYYDNYQEKLKTSPTFTPENWTWLPEWTMNQHPDTLTQNQKNEIMLLTMNLAYYKETGTWLGE